MLDVVCFNKGDRGAAVLAAVASRHRVRGVVLAPGGDDPSLAPAGRLGVPVLRPERLHDPASLAALQALAADVFVLAGFTRIVRESIFRMPRRLCINLHGGRIPDYRGCAPINWMVINGETEGGLAVLEVDATIDAGPILAEDRYAIGPEDTAADCVRRTLERFPPMVLDVLDRLERGTLVRTPQDPKAGAYWSRRHPEDGAVRWETATAREIVNLVRGLVPPLYPGAWARFDDRPVVFASARPLDERVHGVPGRIPFFRGESAVVCARDRAFLLDRVWDPALRSAVSARAALPGAVGRRFQ